MKSPKIISEEVTKADVDKKITQHLSSKSFKEAVTSIVRDRLKNEPDLEDKMVEISKNVLTQLFKTLWVKRNTWRNNLDNKSS